MGIELTVSAKELGHLSKVEKILKGSLDEIPSVKIIESKKFVDITQQCFASLPQVNFPANNLNIH
jgi:hypothetical protein